MEVTTNSIESLLESVEAYGKTTYELSKLKALDATSSVASSLISRLIIIILAMLFVFVLSIGIALMIGDMMGKTYYGFLIVAAFYLLAVIIAHYSLDNVVKKSMSSLMISQLG
jgi:uncharacterized membrane protein